MIRVFCEKQNQYKQGKSVNVFWFSGCHVSVRPGLSVSSPYLLCPVFDLITIAFSNSPPGPLDYPTSEILHIPVCRNSDSVTVSFKSLSDAFKVSARR